MEILQNYLEIIFGSGKSYAGVDIAKSGVEGGLYGLLTKSRNGNRKRTY